MHCNGISPASFVVLLNSFEPIEKKIRCPVANSDRFLRFLSGASKLARGPSFPKGDPAEGGLGYVLPFIPHPQGPRPDCRAQGRKNPRLPCSPFRIVAATQPYQGPAKGGRRGGRPGGVRSL